MILKKTFLIVWMFSCMLFLSLGLVSAYSSNEFNDSSTTGNVTMTTINPSEPTQTKYLEWASTLVVTAGLNLTKTGTSNYGGDGALGVVKFNASDGTADTFGNMVDGVDYSNTSNTLTLLKLNHEYNFSSFELGAGMTLTTTDTSGSVLYLRSQSHIIIDGTVNLDDILTTVSSYTDSHGRVFPTQSFAQGGAGGGGGEACSNSAGCEGGNGGSASSGYGGGGGGGGAYAEETGLEDRDAVGGNGAIGSASSPTGGSGGACPTTDDSTNGGNGGTGGGGGGACAQVDGSADPNGGNGGTTGNGANGNDGGASSTYGASGGGGGGGGGQRGSTYGIHFYMEANYIDGDGGTYDLTGTAGGVGGNGGDGQANHQDADYCASAGGGGGGGGGGGTGAGSIYYIYGSVTEGTGTESLTGGAGGSGGAKGSFQDDGTGNDCDALGGTVGSAGTSGNNGTTTATQFSNQFPPYKPYITLNGTTIWNYTDGVLNDQNRTPDFASTMQSFLNVCNYAGDVCTIPFTFHTFSNKYLSTAGITYLALLFDASNGFVENSRSFNSSTIEGSTEPFEINITYDASSYPNINVRLRYNNTFYASSSTGDGNNKAFLTTLTVPSVSVNTNISFYWEINLINSTGGNLFNSTTSTQEVQTLGIDDCSAHSFLILNYTMIDEDEEFVMNGTALNTSVEVDVNLYPQGSDTAIITFSGNYSQNNNPQVCLANDLAGSTYRLFAQAKYTADDYAVEYNNIQNFSLSNSTSPQNIDLLDLLDSHSEDFIITFKDANFLPVEDALIQIQRKYINQGVFKTVEIPKTDKDGKTIAHLVLNDAIYTIIVTKNGQTLGTFDNVRAICQNPTIEDCTISLNVFTSTLSTHDFTQIGDFTYLFTFNRSSRTLRAIYTIPSGGISTVLLNSTLFDQIGSTEVCSDSIASSSGTLTCVVPSNFGNGSVVAKLSKDGVLLRSVMIDLQSNPKDTYGASIIFLSIFLLLTLAGIGLGSNPMVSGIFLVIGMVLLLGFNMVTGNVSNAVGLSAGIMWLILAIIIVLIKGAKRS